MLFDMAACVTARILYFWFVRRDTLVLYKTLLMAKAIKERIILGIDPGTNVMGYALLAQKGNTISMLSLGVIDLKKISDPYLKLERIYGRIVGIIDEFKPDELAIEAPFFGKNVQSMLKLGRAQGVAIAAGLSRQLPITEYAPLKVKQSVTGSGAASKEQVAAMLVTLLHLTEVPAYLDATDALAVAVCHHFQTDRALPGATGKAFSSWKDFVSSNPARVSKP